MPEKKISFVLSSLGSDSRALTRGSSVFRKSPLFSGPTRRPSITIIIRGAAWSALTLKGMATSMTHRPFSLLPPAARVVVSLAFHPGGHSISARIFT